MLGERFSSGLLIRLIFSDNLPTLPDDAVDMEWPDSLAEFVTDLGVKSTGVTGTRSLYARTARVVLPQFQDSTLR